MLEVSIDTSELQKIPLGRNPRRVQEIAIEGFELTMAAALSILRRAVVKKTPDAFGYLRNSILPTVSKSAGLIPEVRGRLGSSLQYALYVEEGTRPRKDIGAKMPPDAPVRLWARRKLQLQGDELDRAVYAIRLKIYNEGTKGAKMFELGFQETEPRIISLFDKAVEKIAAAVYRELIAGGGA